MPRADGQPKFATFDIVLGTIYTVACAIEVLGIIAATTVRHSFHPLTPRFRSSHSDAPPIRASVWPLSPSSSAL